MIRIPHYRIRPRDQGGGWAIDHYDARGAWKATVHGNLHMSRDDARLRVARMRRAEKWQADG